MSVHWSQGSSEKSPVHGGIMRVKLPAVQALKSALQLLGAIEQVGVGAVLTQLDKRYDGTEVSMVVMVESGMPDGGRITV